MRKIKIQKFNNIYHLAKDEREWIKAVKEKCKKEGDAHHVFGRYGILKRIVENGIIVDRELHEKEKSLDFDERLDFKRKVHDIYVAIYNEDMFQELYTLMNFIKYQNYEPKIEDAD